MFPLKSTMQRSPEWTNVYEEIQCELKVFIHYIKNTIKNYLFSEALRNLKKVKSAYNMTKLRFSAMTFLEI